MKQRSRIIKPDFFQDEKVNNLSYAEQILFIGLWTLADKRGLLEYIPDVIRSFIFPFKPKTDIKKMFKNMEKIGFIKKYANNCKQYIHIINFERHQHIHPHEAQYDIPNVNTLNDITLNVITSNDKLPTSSITSTVTSTSTTTNVGQATNNIPYDNIIKDLNTKAGSSYQSTSDATRKLIVVLWKKYNIDDFYSVHTKMVAEWGNDIKMKRFLRPSTLYNSSKFEEYLNKPKLKKWGSNE